MRQLDQVEEIIVPRVVAKDQVALIDDHEDDTAKVEWISPHWLSERFRDTKA